MFPRDSLFPLVGLPKSSQSSREKRHGVTVRTRTSTCRSSRSSSAPAAGAAADRGDPGPRRRRCGAKRRAALAQLDTLTQVDLHRDVWGGTIYPRTLDCEAARQPPRLHDKWVAWLGGALCRVRQSFSKNSECVSG